MAARFRSKWAGVLRTPVGVAAAALLAAVLLLAILAPVLWSSRANAIDPSQILRGSSSAHWMGTDNLGRDIFFRVLVATRRSIELALAATAIGVVIGLLLGAAPLLLGARAGRLVTAIVNIAVAFPGLLLALFFAVIFGVGARGALLAIGLAFAPGFARLTQTLVARIAGLDFIAAARIAGVGRMRLLVRHVLPNIGEPLVVNATVSAGGALLAFAGLSFLGLGVQPPDYDWGRLLGDGLNTIYVHPAAALAPGVAVVIAGLSFNLFGEALAKAIGLRTARVNVGRIVSRRSRSIDLVAPAVADDRPVLVVDGLKVSFPGATGTTRAAGTTGATRATGTTGATRATGTTGATRATGAMGTITPVRGVSFTVGRGEAVGLVGESGSGKSLTALATGQLIEAPGEVTADRLEFLGTDLVSGSARAYRELLGTSLAMVFQDPMTSFNPTARIGRQLAEVAEQHQGLSRRLAWSRAVDRLRAVRIPAPLRRAHQYPHEFSGGMRQRAMIGMGLMASPALIIADEPTTALDVTVQRQVLRLLTDIRAADDVALLLISHDITVVSQVCDRVLVMYAGRIVEDLPAAELADSARHPYTRALLAAVPDMSTDRDRPLTVIPGRPVDPAQPPPGCAFAPRCPLADERCATVEPALESDNRGGRVACWHPAGQPHAVAPAPTSQPLQVG
jgi:oligopeptide/dipeptide ABC transporter ATP-binding protein